MKDLEFGQVFLTGGHFELTNDKEIPTAADKVRGGELNLQCVDATHAERAIHLNDSIRRFLRAVRRNAYKNARFDVRQPADEFARTLVSFAARQ
ncbi:hypothetical protein [Burkholderia ubonensis]|uniref:hypothetical protein n=1 Tax=Burkholderia ubonensis TaxID=101571 RepID=UPI001054A8D4|nr:hypothetical protein [Burkholderia ubonensis]